MAERIGLTKTYLEQLATERAGQRVVVHDTRQPGLLAEMREGGTITFQLYKRMHGRPKRYTIGRFPQWSVEAARKEAAKVLGEVAKGNDPQAERQAQRREHTVEGLFGHWLDNHAKLHKRTWPEDERQFNKFLAPWKKRRLSTISKAEVQALHARVGKDHGPYAANRLLALTRAMFNKADDIGFRGANPTRGIKKFAEQSRDRFLTPEEVPAFFLALNAEPQIFQDLFMLALLTGARRSNVQAMAWADLHLESATWRIPTTKSGEPVFVHLPIKAVEILKRRQQEATGSPWVFPGGKKNRAGHITSPKGAWHRLRQAAGMPDLRIHDLRRTLGSWQAIAGASLQVIGKNLGHKSMQATERYSRLTTTPVINSVDAATTAILAAATPEAKPKRKRTTKGGKANGKG